MSQLTQQIAGAYIGAQVHWNGNTQCRVIDVIRSKYLHNMKLILTPLSVISDEDAVEVARICGFIDEFTSELSRAYYTNYIKTKYLKKGDFVRGLAQHIIDYLRSRNYDLGYMGIKSLIDAGIAISSTDKIETK